MARLADRDLIEPKVLAKLLQFSAEDLFYQGQQARIPLARVPTMEELFNVDQYIARQTFGTVEQGDQQFQAPNVPFRLFSTPPHFGGPVAELGEHNLSWSTL